MAGEIMRKEISEEFFKTADRDLLQVMKTKPVPAPPPKPVRDPLVEKLSAYCQNRDYCRRELEELLPLYGRQLEKLILQAVERGRSIDGLVALVGKHLVGEATDEDILKFLESGEPAPRRKTFVGSIIDALVRLRSTMGRLLNPKRRALIIDVLPRLRSALGRLFNPKRRASIIGALARLRLTLGKLLKRSAK